MVINVSIEALEADMKLNKEEAATHTHIHTHTRVWRDLNRFVVYQIEWMKYYKFYC